MTVLSPRRAFRAAFFAAACALPAAAQELEAPLGPDLGDGPHLIDILVDGRAAIRAISDLALDVPCGQTARVTDGMRHASVLASGHDIEQLNARGVSWTLVQPELDNFYSARLAAGVSSFSGSPQYGAGLVPTFGQGGMGGYYTYAEIVAILDQLTASYPSLISAKQSIGTSLEGRNIWAVKISDNPNVDESEPEVRFDALHHSREPQGMQTMIWFMSFLLEDYDSDPLATYLVNEREMWFIPVVNPDGYEYNRATFPGGGGLWRKNRRPLSFGNVGVDINRNYPFQWGFDNVGSSNSGSSETYRGASPASEPETQAMTAFISSRPFATALSIHTFSNLWLEPYGYDFVTPPDEDALHEIAVLAVEDSGYVAGSVVDVLYLANGGTIDYDYGVHDILSWTPEIGGPNDGFWPPSSRIVPLAEENLRGLARTALAGGTWLRLLDVDTQEVGNSNGAFEAGESIDLDVTLRNTGRDASGSATVNVTTSSPFLTASTGSTGVPSLAPFTSSAPLTLTLDIAANAPSGSALAYTVSFTYDGFTQSVDGTIVTGTPRTLLVDDIEADFGWTVGVASDTATDGLWERADPLGNDFNGEPAAPNNDATPGPSTFAYVTGNGSSDAGVDDVDNGKTTLITPRFDLTGVGAAIVSYNRWYADLSVLDDIFEVSISNDDGFSWTTLEALTATANDWTRVEFLVTEVITPTDEMRIRFVASDDPNTSICEAAIDDLEIAVYGDRPHTVIWGRPEIDTQVRFALAGEPGASYIWYLSPATANLTIGSVNGPLLIDPNLLIPFLAGTLPASGRIESDLTLPNDAGLIGLTAYFQALTIDNGARALSNRYDLTVQ